MTPTLRLTAPLLTGAMLLLSYPPYNQAWLAWFTLVPFLWSVAEHPRTGRRGLLRDACLAGSVWSAGHFYPLLFVEGGSWLERGVGFLAITGILIAFLYLFSILFRRLVINQPVSVWRAIGVSSATWIGLEYVFRSMAVGFSPYLGITQWQVPWLLQVASWGGVHLISALILMVNGLLFHGCRMIWRPAALRPEVTALAGRPQTGRAASASWSVSAGLVIVGFLYASGFFSTWNESEVLRPVVGEEAAEDTWVAALVQPGFTPADYFEAASLGWDGHQRMFDQVMDQTRTALQQNAPSLPAVVFWPETTLHIDVLALHENRAAVAELAREFGVGFVLGVPRYIPQRPDDDAASRSAWSWLTGVPREYNSARVITPDGVERQVYDKMYVIPIAEAQYAPGQTIEPVYPLAGPGHSGPAVGVGICSDVIEPGHARTAVQAGARTLHYLSALSRIGSLAELEKAFVVMRAAEHRVYMTQTATTGPTMVVDPYGRVIESMATAGPDVRFVELPGVEPAPTLYTRRGDWPIIIGAALLILSGIQGWIISRRTSRIT